MQMVKKAVKAQRQILATGICKTSNNGTSSRRGNHLKPRFSSRLAGFTLIEILLVLVLLSLTAVAVIATLPTRSDERGKKYAQSFYQRLQLLNEEAVLSGKDFGVRVEEEKSRYTLLKLEADGWQTLELNKIPATTELEDEVAMQLTLGGGAWQQDDRLFKPGSLFDEEMFADEEKEKKQRPPQIFFLSSGELTPFSLSFYPDDQDATENGWRVRAKDTGQIILLAPGEEEQDDG
ncbi:type II secretion system protein GspH [Vibrio vulnificus]|uniref:type II secretion system minor pseudopilin GspH n=1 Tax=Vibrio vulnificus TaxID=672 RepID=UPI0009B7FA31|nr:type II secretion system minor pseudopilin GspH [Vibrio vulnificus]PWY28432.1 type II secretion system protein GspH [Vibrio vulnificus]